MVDACHDGSPFPINDVTGLCALTTLKTKLQQHKSQRQWLQQADEYLRAHKQRLPLIISMMYDTYDTFFSPSPSLSLSFSMQSPPENFSTHIDLFNVSCVCVKNVIINNACGTARWHEQVLQFEINAMIDGQTAVRGWMENRISTIHIPIAENLIFDRVTLGISFFRSVLPRPERAQKKSSAQLNNHLLIGANSKGKNGQL